MASTLAGIEKLDDPARLEKIDKLRELGIGNYIPLPQLVVVGDQSSGKSSVLEGLTELPFPRDSTLCTRFATQTNFRRADQDTVSISIIPSPTSEAARKVKLRGFREDESKAFTRERIASILSNACKAMGIPAPGNSRAPEQSAFSEDVLKIELCGPSKPHLSVIDVPGIFRTPTEGLTTKEDISMVRRMVHKYIENSRTIILAVTPANVDIATQEILTIAADVDPSGQRTLGVITKPDLVDKGAEQDVVDLVLGRRNRLRLGYFIVRNRGQQDKSTSAEDRHRQETEFFNSSPWSSDTSRVGIFSLKARLIQLLNETTRREYPRVD